MVKLDRGIPSAIQTAPAFEMRLRIHRTQLTVVLDETEFRRVKYAAGLIAAGVVGAGLGLDRETITRVIRYLFGG